MQKSTIGTYYFFPPESCSSEVSEFSGKAADVWALGITLYALVYKKLPFWSDSLAGIFEVIQNFDLELDSQVLISNELKHLIFRLLDKNPNTRIKIFELLQHPWLTKILNSSNEEKNALLGKKNSEYLKTFKALAHAVRII